jgi:HPt (histidine-containing phosphotransfer) domain-containing protein
MNSEKPAMKNRADIGCEPVTLDLPLARENFGCDEALLCEIATVFIEDVPQLIAQLEHACQANDKSTVCRTAHSLKGLCATFGAEPARTYAQNIEQECGQNGDAAITCERLQPLILALEHTIATLRSELRLSA